MEIIASGLLSIGSQLLMETVFAVGTQTKNMPSASSKTAPVITVVRWDICKSLYKGRKNSTYN